MRVCLKHILCLSGCCFAVLFFSCVSSPKPAVSEPPAEEVGVQTPEKNAKPAQENTGAKKLTVVQPQIEEVPEESAAPDPLEEYKALSENLRLKVQNAPAETKSGSAFTSDFSVSVTDAQGNKAPGVVVTVKYPSNRIENRILFATEDIQSDENGTVHFTCPIPEFSCIADVSFYPAASVQDERVLQYAEEHAVKIPYRVRTDKTNKSLSLSILDYTQAGKPITTNSLSSSAILKALYRKGFRSAGNSDFVDDVHNGNVQSLYRHASALFGGSINYLIFGTVKHETPVTKGEDGLYETTLRADIRIMNMANSEIILQTTQSFTAKEKNEWLLMDRIRNTLMAPALVDYIYYHF
ncbi:hypothetical protein HMPREF9194_01100 [Treponema maltophilum ATCC 51939]|uniref:Uncharacterized protein n=1 Tax=Treponema maltophilum ATCC 51939 TaxID=1125699 RepID=S3JXS8_TREMA|nr:hypothetical protein [Treponema maltophilum]EPF30778.1 hypothetical protein HMPREF9194_01100 [Treponema maltophilum ATCC 51939]